MGMRFPEFVCKDEANVAKQLMTAAGDGSAKYKTVKGEVEAHNRVWLA